MKNAVLLHLEGISHTMLWQYHDQMPAIHRLKNDSMYFSRFQVAGTATIFMYYALQHGSLSLLDGVGEYFWSMKQYPLQTGFGELLRDGHGYDLFAFSLITKGSLDKYRSQKIPMNMFNKVLGVDDTVCLGHIDEPDERALSERLRRQKTSGKPFLMIFSEPYEYYHIEPGSVGVGDNIGEKFKDEYVAADNSVKLLMKSLEESGLLEDTMIVAFGDHGLSTFDRWFNDIGVVGGTYADASASWTPLMIYNSPMGKGVRSDIASSLDLKPTILNLLFPDRYPAEEDKDQLLFGRDLTRSRRGFATTQNSFALQDKTNTLKTRKSYALCDDNYRLIVSAVQGEREGGGMEMFMDVPDPANNTNLLDLFVLDAQGNVIDYNLVKLANISRWKFFYGTFGPNILADLTKRYTVMRKELMRAIAAKESAGMKTPGAQPHFFPMESFNRVAPVKYSAALNQPEPQKIIRRLAEKGKPIVLFGAGLFGQKLLPLLRLHNLGPKCFIDNNRAIANTAIEDLRVFPPEELPDDLRKNALVLISLGRSEEIDAQCQKLGFDYCYYTHDLCRFPEA